MELKTTIKHHLQNFHPLELWLSALLNTFGYSSAKTTELEVEIDQLVYQLYNLIPKEIAIVEGRG